MTGVQTCALPIWLHQLLSPDRCIVRSPRSYNSQIGVPLSVWQLSEEAELGIFEAGISEMGEMGALKRMIKPTIGILTNIGGAHQENFFSLQEKCMEKLTLFKDCDVVIYNGDNELISNCVAKSMLTAREIACQLGARLPNMRAHQQGTSLEVHRTSSPIMFVRSSYS